MPGRRIGEASHPGPSSRAPSLSAATRSSALPPMEVASASAATRLSALPPLPVVSASPAAASRLPTPSRSSPTKRRPPATPCSARTRLRAKTPPATPHTGLTRASALPGLPSPAKTTAEDLDTMLAEIRADQDAAEAVEEVPRSGKTKGQWKSLAVRQGVWRCPLCTFSTPTDTHKWRSRKYVHIKSWHPEQRRALKAKPVATDREQACLEHIPLGADCKWRCPLCDMGVKEGTQIAVQDLIRAHRTQAHPTAPVQVFSRLHRKNQNILKAHTQNANAWKVAQLAALKGTSHGPVEFMKWPWVSQGNSKRAPASRLLCTKCGRLERNAKALVKVPCQPGQPEVPTAASARTASNRRRLIERLKKEGSEAARCIAAKLEAISQ